MLLPCETQIKDTHSETDTIKDCVTVFYWGGQCQFTLTLLESRLLSFLMQQAAEPGNRLRREWYRYPAMIRNTFILLQNRQKGSLMFKRQKKTRQAYLTAVGKKNAYGTKSLSSTSLRGPRRLQEGGRGMVTLEGKLAVWVPAGQKAGHARPDSTVPLEEPVTLLVIAYMVQGTRKMLHRLVYRCCMFLAHFYETNFNKTTKITIKIVLKYIV